jgi:hypothetical protein
VRVLVAGQLPREAHNAPQHLFSASQELLDFAGLPVGERLAGLSAEQIRQYLKRLTAGRPSGRRKPRQKK